MNKPSKVKKRIMFRTISKRSAYFSVAVLLVAGLVLPVLLPRQGSAALLSARSLKLSSSAKGDISLDSNGVDVCAITTFANPQGGCGAKAKHTVTFTMATSGATTGAIIIMYCTSPIFSTTCTTPTSMTAANLTAVTVSGLNATSNFTIDNVTTNATINGNSAVSANGVCNGAGTTRTNCVVMKRGTAQTETGTPAATIHYGGSTADYIVNPIPAGNENYTFYARVLVLNGTDLSTAALVDYGGLAASTAQQVDITAKVQEILRFSVGTTSTAKVSNAACTPYSDSGALTLGDTNDVLDPALAYTDYSYFRVNTNTVNGTIVAYSGDTLISGTNNIDALTSEVSSTTGTEQFGLAIDNSAPAQDYEFVSLAANANYDEGAGTVTTGGTARFNFSTASKTAPVTIATSSAGITCDTGAVRYIANISTSTPAGIYRTTITYIATGTY